MATTGFTGRAVDLARLSHRLREVDRTGRGQAVTLTGRRRVGKSRLVQEFCDQAQAPYVIFQATRGRSPAAERADFVATVGESSLPSASLVRGLQPADWNQALRTLVSALPSDTPSVVVLDEVPWLVAQDKEFEGALQTVWDMHMCAKPVLLLLIGSDRAVMEALATYGRPFYGRAAQMVLRPLNPYDVAQATALPATEAIDAYLVTGGFPELVTAWPPGTSRVEYLRAQLSDPLSPLLMAGELTMLGEFPEPTYAREVLAAIGAGETTFSRIARHVGGDAGIPAGTLAPLLRTLTEKRVVTVDLPLSTKADQRNKRYRVADCYLRFWLAFLRRGIAEAERGRGDRVAARIEQAWPTWRGRAVEPLVREALHRLLPDQQWPDTEAVGGWWNRQNNPEIDLVGADRAPARRVHFVGSVKWLGRPFDGRDAARLARDRTAVPGVDEDTPMVAVSRCGFRPDLLLAAAWTPEDVLAAWAPAEGCPRD